MRNHIDKNGILNYCIDIRRHLHRFPELSFKEYETSKYIIQQLKDNGITAHAIAKTGVYALIDTKRPGPTIAFRADIDALPIKEENNVAYASEKPGIMHACGHDGHVAILLGFAKVLNQNNADLKGKIMLLFQPGEESADNSGALSIMNQGILKNVDAVFALHINTLLPTGFVSVKSGPILAAYDSFQVEVLGKAGHGGMPHICIDPIIIGCQLVNSWQTIISRKIDPLCPAVLTTGTFLAGDNFNVISESANITGCTRFFSKDIGDLIEKEFKDMTEYICQSHGAKANIIYNKGCPPLMCDEVLTYVVKCAAIKHLEQNNVVESGPFMGSDDFSFYGSECPSAYFFLGAGNKPKGLVYPMHHPCFDFDEEAMINGVNIFYSILDQLWQKNNMFGGSCDA